MAKIAVFIGGEFDMAKRALTSALPEVSFSQPIDRGFVADHPGSESNVPCKQITYRLQYETKHGTLIYELDRFDA